MRSPRPRDKPQPDACAQLAVLPAPCMGPSAFPSRPNRALSHKGGCEQVRACVCLLWASLPHRDPGLSP